MLLLPRAVRGCAGGAPRRRRRLSGREEGVELGQVEAVGPLVQLRQPGLLQQQLHLLAADVVLVLVVARRAPRLGARLVVAVAVVGLLVRILILLFLISFLLLLLLVVVVVVRRRKIVLVRIVLVLARIAGGARGRAAVASVRVGGFGGGGRGE